MTDLSTSAGKMSQGSDLLFGHPKGLYILTSAEMLERFSFYGVRALLVLYLTQKFLYSDDLAFGLYGTYMALVNMSPMIGGLIADRYLGFRKGIYIGGVLLILGHLGLVFGDFYLSSQSLTDPVQDMQLFYLSMALLITGVGLFKPNITSLVGGLYPEGGSRADSGFTIFFLGINIGAASAAVVCGYIGQKFGWHYGFGLAGIGVTLGLATFVLGRKYLNGLGHPAQPLAKMTRLGIGQQPLIYISILLFILMSWKLVTVVQGMGVLVVGIFLFAFGGAVYYGLKHLEKLDREKLFCALILMIIWIFFAALIEQQGSSMNLFITRAVDLQVALPDIFSSAGGEPATFAIQSSQMLGIPGLMIILFSPAIIKLWGFLERHNINPSTPAKFAISLLFMGAGFATLSLGTALPNEQGQVDMFWILLSYLFIAVGDLFIVPVGLSAVTKLSAPRIIGFMMGLWLLSVAIGQYLAALVAQLSSIQPAHLLTMETSEILVHYQGFFTYLAIGAGLLGGAALLMTPFIRKWMHGEH